MINPRFLKLAKRQMNPNPPKPLERTKRKSLTGILERDSDGEPVLKLTPMKKRAVSTPTQESYDELLRVYECGGWKWIDGDLPTGYNNWQIVQEKTCLDAGVNYSDEKRFGYGDKEWFEANDCEVISTSDFYNAQDPPITKKMIDEVNLWFEQNG